MPRQMSESYNFSESTLPNPCFTEVREQAQGAEIVLNSHS